MSFSEQYFPTYFSVVYRKFQKFINKEMAEYDIKSSEFPFLVCLTYPPNTLMQDEMCKRTAIDKGAATRALQSLESKGLIYRQESEHGYRSNCVFLTDKGRSLLPIIETTLDSWTNYLLEDFTPHEKEVLKKQLNSITKKLKD